MVLHHRGDFRDERVDPQPRLRLATKGEELFELVEYEQGHRARPDGLRHLSVEILPQRLRPIGGLTGHGTPERLAISEREGCRKFKRTSTGTTPSRRISGKSPARSSELLPSPDLTEENGERVCADAAVKLLRFGRATEEKAPHLFGVIVEANPRMIRVDGRRRRSIGAHGSPSRRRT